MKYRLNLATALLLSACFALIASGCSDSAQSQSGEYEVVQLIGNYNNATIEAVRSDLVVVPFSPDYNPQLTPMMIAPGVLDPVDALTEQEKDAIKASYEAGQTLALIAPSTIDVKAFHGLLGAGAAFESTTDPVLLAYIMRREDGMPTASALFNIRPTPDAENPGADERAYARAYDLVVDDLSRSPLPSSEPTSDLTGAPIDLSKNYVQSTTLKELTGGYYTMPVKVSAGRICKSTIQAPTDFYVITSGGDWDPTEAQWQSASKKDGQISLKDNDDDLSIDWQNNDHYCSGGIAVDKGFGGGGDSRICRYANYPLNYYIGFEPPALNGSTTQESASPSANQGRETTYSNAFTYGVNGTVSVNGKGPQAGIGVSATWQTSVSTTVPAMVVEAGNLSPSGPGAYTKYEYCTEDDAKAGNCSSMIQMEKGTNVCQDYIVGDPQDGQKPTGKLSNTLQAAAWQVTPGTYGDATSFDIVVNWDVELATSTAYLWGGSFEYVLGPIDNSIGVGPTGTCNSYGCSCSFKSETTQTLTKSYTFNVPLPSDCSTPPPPPPACSAAFCDANPNTRCTATTSCAYCDQSECHE